MIPPIPPGIAQADLIATLNDRIRRMNLLATAAAPATTVAANGGIQVIDRLLAVASTTIAVPTNGATDLVVILRQDGTGGRAVVWGPGFSGASTSLGAALASTISTFRFVLSGGKYVQAGQQTTDMTTP